MDRGGVAGIVGTQASHEGRRGTEPHKTMSTYTPTKANEKHYEAARFADTIRKAARRAIAEALDNDEDPYAVARIWRAYLKEAWSAALTDTGMDEEHAAKLRFPL